MLYIIGLGLNVDGISMYGLEIAKRCKKIYLENYTVNFPYKTNDIKKIIGKKMLLADREKVEGLSIIDEAKKMDVALLVYGSPLTATTHITLLDEAKKSRVKCRVVYNASVFDAAAETGLQLYKFGKISSMPAWKKSFEPDSFMENVQQNMSIKAHSMILIDIGLGFQDALNQLEISAKNHKINLKKMVLCQMLGTSSRKILYGDFEDFKNVRNVRKPYCIIFPGKLHFAEKEFLENYAL